MTTGTFYRGRAAQMLAQLDESRIAELVRLGSTPSEIARIQAMAVRTMAQIGYRYPRKSCAATLSHFLREAGIDVPITTGAQRLADRLRVNRGWARVDRGDQRAGDVGVCYSMAADVPGADHIYLVVERRDEDLMLIADNQVQGATHERRVSGGHKTPTEYFLRAASDHAFALQLDGAEGSEVSDESTSELPEPFMDDGTPSLMDRDGSVVEVN